MNESRLPPSDEWRCVRCDLVLPSPGEGRPPISCLSDLGGCGRGTEWCEHESPVEGCEPCEKGYTRFFPASWGNAHVQLYIDTESGQFEYRSLVEFYKRSFRTDDTAPLDACLATVATGWTEGDALWLYVVGAPGSGKTELVRAFADGRKRAYFLSSLTPNSLVSGLKDGKHLLPELDGKTLIIKDFTMTLESHRENRDALFGALRDAYDGSYSKAFGSVGTIGFDSHFNLIACVTSAIDGYYTVQSILGQRFLIVRTSFPDDFDSDQERDLGAFREGLKERIDAALRSVQEGEYPPCPPGFVEEIKSHAREIALLRAHIHREGQSRELAALPEPEAPARLTNQLLKLARGLAAIRHKSEVTADEMDLVRRVVADTVPTLRVRILKAVHEGTETTDGLASLIGISRPTMERHLEDLSVLGAISTDVTVRPYLHRVGRSFSFLSSSSRTPEPSAETLAPSVPTAPALFPVDPATIRDKDKLFGGKNLAHVFHHIQNKVRLDAGRPDVWIAKDAMLAFQMPENAQGAALGLVQIVRSMGK